MIFIRSLLFNICFYAWNLGMFIICLPVLLLPRKIYMGAVKAWLFGFVVLERLLLGIKYRVIGRENLPPAPCIIAAKHQSEWETLKLHLLLRDPAIVLKRELLFIPFFGWYLLKAGMIAIDRGAGSAALRGMLKAAQKVADEKRDIAIFPQGTRVAVGAQKPYKSGVAALYDHLKLPVVPMAVNSGLFWPKNSFLKYPGTITVEFLPAIPPGLSRAEMMQKLETQLEKATNKLVANAISHRA